MTQTNTKTRVSTTVFLDGTPCFIGKNMYGGSYWSDETAIVHAGENCVLFLDEDAARNLRDVLTSLLAGEGK